MKQYFASDFAYGVAPNVAPLKIGVGNTTTGAATTYILYDAQCVSSTPSQESFFPLATNAPVLLGSGTIQETVTPSAVTNLPIGQSSSVAFSSTTNAHGNGSNIASGTVGLQEALNFLSNSGNGGGVVVDGRWAQLGGTTSMITSAANPTGSAVFIIDNRGASPAWYTWNGSAFVASAGSAFPAGANGQSFAPFATSELVTLSLSGATTDSVANLLPANSIILAVNGTVNTTITGSSDWKLGDATTAGRFSAADSTLTAAESVPKASFPPVQIGTGVASATTGVYQAAAAKVRITVTTTATVSKIRVTVYGFTLVNATT